MAAPTFFGYGTNPDDTPGSLAEPQTGATLTPPGSMLAGDLVVVYLYNESGSAGDGMQINNQGGQTWTSDTTNGSYSYTGSAAGHRIYWCTFNGTWSANPTFDFPAKSGTRACGMQMLVFRPDSTSKVWGVDVAPSWAGYSAPSTPFTVTVTGVTPTKDDSVTIARWASDDDNTWGSLSGAGWSKTSLLAQYRNQGGSDISTTFAYYLQGASPTSTGDVSQNQATLGGDAGSTVIITFYAASASPSITPAVGSLTTTGQTPTLIRGTLMTPAVVSLTTSGSAPTVLQGTPITPGVGSLTTSGNAPSLFKQEYLTPGVGSLTPSGNAPTLFTETYLTPGVGTATFSGFAPTIVQNFLLTPANGSLTLTGEAPTISTSTEVNITPAVATLTFSGNSFVQDLAMRPDTA